MQNGLFIPIVLGATSQESWHFPHGDRYQAEMSVPVGRKKSAQECRFAMARDPSILSNKARDYWRPKCGVWKDLHPCFRPVHDEIPCRLTVAKEEGP